MFDAVQRVHEWHAANAASVDDAVPSEAWDEAIESLRAALDAHGFDDEASVAWVHVDALDTLHKIGGGK